MARCACPSILAAAAVVLASGCFLQRAGTQGGPMDGGPDAAPCVAVAETCNGGDDDCDGRTDEGFDLRTDRENCGSCGNACAADPANASSACTGGACVLTCDPGFDDCDGDPANGCEARLSDPATCGSCGVTCAAPTPFCAGDPPTCIDTCPAGTTDCGASCVDTATDALHCGGCGAACPAPPGASPSCVASACDFTCDAGLGDCNGGAGDGCEVELARSPAHCGACGNACPARANAAATCAMGSCGFTCDPRFGDCDGSAGNGCEVDLRSDESHCGACGTACPGRMNASPTCSARTCGYACNPGFDDCDGSAGNGCESDLQRDPSNCGACGTVCPSGGCAMGVCGMCGGTTADCDMDPATGCEADLTGVDHCFSCANECAIYQGCDPGGMRCADSCPACGAVCASPVGCCEGGCPGSSCSFTRSGGGCLRVVDCRDKSSCSIDCNSGARCAVDCRRTGTCDFQCSDAGSSCVMDCRGATSCSMQCSADHCLLRCDPGAGSACEITSCSTPVRACADGEHFACGLAACP